MNESLSCSFTLVTNCGTDFSFISPTNVYKTGYEEPFYIDISDTSVGTMIIELSEYALTADCVVYEAFVDGVEFDPFDEPNPIATIS